MNVKLCYPKTADTPIFYLYRPRHILGNSIDGVSLQELNLEAHVPMASLKRGLGVNFTIATRSNFKKLFYD